MSHENLEKDTPKNVAADGKLSAETKKPVEGQAQKAGTQGKPEGAKQPVVHKKKVSVVFRSQNSSSLKELPKSLRGQGQHGTPQRRQGDRRPAQPAQQAPRGPRPLPAGTKPVKPAVFGEHKEAVKEPQISAAQQTQAQVQAQPQVRKEEAHPTQQAALQQGTQAASVKPQTAPVQAQPQQAEKAPLAQENTQKPAAQAKPAAERPQESGEKRAAKPQPEKKPAVKRIPDGLPQIRIVKSYADYDAAAVIAKAAAERNSKLSERNAENRGERRGTGRPGQGGGQRSGGFGARKPQSGPYRPSEGGQRSGGPGRPGFGGGQRPQPGRGNSAPAFEAPQGKNAPGRNNKNPHAKDRFERKDKYKDDLNLQKSKNGKGAFIKPEPKKEKPEDDIKVISVPEHLTIRELADKLKMQPSVIIKKLFLEGKMVTPNTDLTYEEAEAIAMEYDILCEKEETVDVIAELLKEDEEDEKDMVPRSPVVCVMGHVDHGKTSLLDAIRNTNVTSHEAGGITQHIGASVVKVGDRKITFLDTPGHEAFTAMRLRGAQATDIAVLVVAADDGVKPQTIEAISHARAAGVEIVVAINKIDKPGANIDRVKKELSEQGLISEDWGGSTTMVPVSAKTGEGIKDLLEMILLEADVLELKANPNRKARGIVIEAQLDKGRGPVATVLVQKGTLKIGDNIAAGACYGKVRAMIDDKGARVKKAGPSMPVEILGLNDVPNAGEVFMGCDDEKEARNIAETFIAEHKQKMLEETKQKMNLDDLFDEIKAGNVKELPIIIKADVQGSVEAVKQSLGKLSNEEVAVNVIHSGVGNINESDVNLASAGNAIIIGFNVKPDATAKSIAEHEKVDIRLYKVIYQAIDDLTAALTGMLAPVYEPRTTGRAIVRQLFKASGVGTIAGCFVTDGIVERGSKARITRGQKQIFDGDIASLKRFKDEVKEVKAGFECGMVFDGFNDLEVDDAIEIYKMVEVPRTPVQPKKDA